MWSHRSTITSQPMHTNTTATTSITTSTNKNINNNKSYKLEIVIASRQWKQQ